MISVTPQVESVNNKQYTLEYRCGQSEQCEPYEVKLLRGRYLLECWGASGSSDINTHSRGAYVSGEIRVETSLKLFAYVGSVGKLNGPRTFNGGGTGSSQGHSGGGATDFRLLNGSYDSLDSLLSRVIIAAGAGGLNLYEDPMYTIYEMVNVVSREPMERAEPFTEI